MKAFLKPYLQPAFLVCALLILTGAASKSLVVRFLGVQLTKIEIPLKLSFNDMDEKSILPYVVRNKQRIDNPDILETLGTEDYLQWILEDPNAEPDSPTRFCSLFVTYYTGNPDMVPHVPQECYVGGGNTWQSDETLKVAVPSAPGGPDSELSFQYVMFSKTDRGGFGAETKFSVQYLFKANGEYSGSRTQTRRILGSNFFSKYSYFAKVEWKFYGIDDFSAMLFPNKEQTLAASQKLLTELVPVLEEDHWPDWKTANMKKTD